MSIAWKPPKDGVFKIVVPVGKGRTKQAPSDFCDINKIVARYRKTGFLEHVRANPGTFADVSGYGDFREMVQTVTLAKESFASLPSALRHRFHNDPGELLAFIADGSNRDEAVKLGILPEPKAEDVVVPPEPVKEVVVPPEPVKEVKEPSAPDKAV